MMTSIQLETVKNAIRYNGYEGGVKKVKEILIARGRDPFTCPAQWRAMVNRAIVNLNHDLEEERAQGYV